MRVVVLTGGVGGAKFVLGLDRCAEVSSLTAIVNTGDDFTHMGLRVSPDIDTLLYTLSGQANAVQGWGREGETWTFMEAVKSLDGPGWFALGDGDLALHVLRTERLGRGEPLSSVTRDFAAAWHIRTDVLPMSDDLVETYVDTEEGLLPFQTYFVARRCQPVVRSVRFKGAERASLTPGLAAAIAAADAIFIAPSNPWLSIDPILAIPGVREAMTAAPASVIAISPIVDGRAVKGPTIKLMEEMGLDVSHETILKNYADLVDGLVHDGECACPVHLRTLAVPTLMSTLEDKIQLAKAALAFADQLAGTARTL